MDLGYAAHAGSTAEVAAPDALLPGFMQLPGAARQQQQQRQQQQLSQPEPAEQDAKGRSEDAHQQHLPQDQQPASHRRRQRQLHRQIQQQLQQQRQQWQAPQQQEQHAAFQDALPR